MTLPLLGCLFVVELWLCYKKPILVAVLWGALASGSDAAGPAGFIAQILPQYALVQNLILILAVCFVVARSSRRSFMSFRVGLAFAFLLIGWMVLSISVNYAEEGVNFIVNASFPLVDFGPLLLIIWLLDDSPCETKMKLLFGFVYFQVILAFLIVYLPTLNVTVLGAFSATHYISDGGLYGEPIRTMADAAIALVDKYAFTVCAQFHNANDLGFYAIASIYLSAFIIPKIRSILLKIGLTAFCLVALLLWLNSGIRGPMIALLVIIVIALAIRKNKSRYFILSVVALILLVIVGFGGADRFLDYILVDSSNVSVVIRGQQRQLGTSFIVQHPFFGNGGMVDELVNSNANPHELPLRMAALFGIPAGLFISAILFAPMSRMASAVKNRSRIALFGCGLILIVYSVAFTNNYTCIALFWFMFAQGVLSLGKIASEPIGSEGDAESAGSA